MIHLYKNRMQLNGYGYQNSTKQWSIPNEVFSRHFCRFWKLIKSCMGPTHIRSAAFAYNLVVLITDICLTTNSGIMWGQEWILTCLVWELAKYQTLICLRKIIPKIRPLRRGGGRAGIKSVKWKKKFEGEALLTRFENYPWELSILPKILGGVFENRLDGRVNLPLLIPSRRMYICLGWQKVKI